MSKKDLAVKDFINSCNQQLKSLEDQKWSKAETERLLIIDSLKWITKNKSKIVEEFKKNGQIKNEKPSFYLLLDEKDEITLIINTGKIIAQGGQRIVSESIAVQKNKLHPSPFVTLESKNKLAEIALEGEIKLSEKFSSNPFIVPTIYGDKVSFSPRMFVLNNLLEAKQGSTIPTQGNMLWMIYSLIKGVDILNSNGLLHNDLKKENILVNINKNGNFCAYIADMGSAALKSDHSIKLIGNFDNMAFDNPVLQPLLKGLLDLDNNILSRIRSLSSIIDDSTPYKNLQTIEDARKVTDTEIETYETLQIFLQRRDAKILEIIRGFEPIKDDKLKPFDSAFTLESANEIPTIRYMLEFIEKNNIADIQFSNEYLTEKDDVWSLCSIIRDMIEWYETVIEGRLPTLFIEIRDQLNLDLTYLEKDRSSTRQLLNMFLMAFNNMILDTNIPEKARQECIQVFLDQSKYYNVELSYLPQTTVKYEKIEENIISKVKKHKSENNSGLISSNHKSNPAKDKTDSISQFGKFYLLFNSKKKAVSTPNTPSPPSRSDVLIPS